MPASTPHTAPARTAFGAALGSMALPGCAAMGELVHHGPWSWVAGTVAVLAVVGFIASRTRR